jgi:hypothetical protein
MKSRNIDIDNQSLDVDLWTKQILDLFNQVHNCEDYYLWDLKSDILLDLIYLKSDDCEICSERLNNVRREFIKSLNDLGESNRR